MMECRGRTLPLGERTLIMGILNVTPDSFSDGGVYSDPAAAILRAKQMVADGADIIDIGAESTKPGYRPVAQEEELARLLPVLQAIVRETPVPISVDTTKAAVAEQALAAGAHLLNDQRALRADPALAGIAAAYQAPVVLMHNQDFSGYHDLIGDIITYLRESVQIALEAGITRDRIIIDPGFGFGKNPRENLELIRRLKELTALGLPVLIGVSRKLTIGRVLDLPVDQRLEGTAAAVAVSIVNGADIVRVHDVKEMSRVARMTDAIIRSGGGDKDGDG